MKIIIILFATVLSWSINCSNSGNTDKNKESEYSVEKKYRAYVPDELTAKKIAEAIWLPIYGQSVLDEKPYHARPVGDSVWIVDGSLKEGALGGTAHIEIRMKDCQVLNVTHGK